MNDSLKISRRKAYLEDFELSRKETEYLRRDGKPDLPCSGITAEYIPFVGGSVEDSTVSLSSKLKDINVSVPGYLKTSTTLIATRQEVIELDKERTNGNLGGNTLTIKILFNNTITLSGYYGGNIVLLLSPKSISNSAAPYVIVKNCNCGITIRLETDAVSKDIDFTDTQTRTIIEMDESPSIIIDGVDVKGRDGQTFLSSKSPLVSESNCVSYGITLHKILNEYEYETVVSSDVKALYASTLADKVENVSKQKNAAINKIVFSNSIVDYGTINGVFYKKMSDGSAVFYGSIDDSLWVKSTTYKSNTGHMSSNRTVNVYANVFKVKFPFKLKEGYTVMATPINIFPLDYENLFIDDGGKLKFNDGKYSMADVDWDSLLLGCRVIKSSMNEDGFCVEVKAQDGYVKLAKTLKYSYTDEGNHNHKLSFFVKGEIK